MRRLSGDSFLRLEAAAALPGAPVIYFKSMMRVCPSISHSAVSTDRCRLVPVHCWSEADKQHPLHVHVLIARSDKPGLTYWADNQRRRTDVWKTSCVCCTSLGPALHRAGPRWSVTQNTEKRKALWKEKGRWLGKHCHITQQTNQISLLLVCWLQLDASYWCERQHLACVTFPWRALILQAFH